MKKNRISQQELAREISNITEYQQNQIVEILNAIDPSIQKLLSGSDENHYNEVGLTRNISFKSVYKPARTGRNPATGEALEIPAHSTTAARFAAPIKHIA